MKKLIGVLLLLLLIAGGAVWYFLAFRLDGAIRQQIEEVAEQSLGTDVRVGAVRTDLKTGSLTISDIEVANPPGYRNPNAFTLRGIEAVVNYQTLEIRRIIYGLIILGVTAILVFAVIGRFFARRYGQPSVLGELVIGIAREAAAVTGQKARVPEITYEEAGAPARWAVMKPDGDAACTGPPVPTAAQESRPWVPVSIPAS